MNLYSLLSNDPWTQVALNLAAKATLLILLGSGLVLLSLRSSAAFRHRIWSLVFISLLLLPAAIIAIPGWDWHVIPSNWQAATPVVREAPPTKVAASPTPAATKSPKPLADAAAAQTSSAVPAASDT